jgi:hypothetical protein
LVRPDSQDKALKDQPHVLLMLLVQVLEEENVINDLGSWPMGSIPSSNTLISKLEASGSTGRARTTESGTR